MRAALRWALAAAAGTAAAVSWLPEDEEDAVVQAVARSAGSQPVAPRPALLATAVAPSPAAASDDAPTVTDPRTDWPALSSAARSAWLPRPVPPPPVPAASAAPAPPPPPAFPYQWLGQIEVEGQTRLFIAGPQRVWAMLPGEVLEQNWRIDGVAMGQLQLTWLATGAVVTLAARP